MKKTVEKTLTITLSEKEARAIYEFLDMNAITDYGVLEELRNFIHEEFPEPEDEE